MGIVSVLGSHVLQAKLQELRESLDAECTFAPKLVSKRRNATSSGDRHQRLYEAALVLQKKKEQMQLAKVDKECTFSPQLVSKRATTREGASASVHESLYRKVTFY